MPVAPRIVNDVSYRKDVTHESHFAWQGQYLVRLEGELQSMMRIIFRGRHSIW